MSGSDPYCKVLDPQGTRQIYPIQRGAICYVIKFVVGLPLGHFCWTHILRDISGRPFVIAPVGGSIGN